MLTTTPFLLFDGTCEAAMSFYHQCLGGNLTLTKLADTPMKDQFPAEKHGRIINARLKDGALDISATDWMASPRLEPKQGNTLSVYLTSPKATQLKSAFEKLSVGADRNTGTFIELRNMPFGAYGQFTDKFGVPWIFRSEEML